VRPAASSDWHKVADLGNSLLREEARQENVRVWEIELFVPHLVEDGMNFETTTFMLVD
jgi:hypothetical protein